MLPYRCTPYFFNQLFLCISFLLYSGALIAVPLSCLSPRTPLTSGWECVTLALLQVVFGAGTVDKSSIVLRFVHLSVIFFGLFSIRCPILLCPVRTCCAIFSLCFPSVSKREFSDFSIYIACPVCALGKNGTAHVPHRILYIPPRVDDHGQPPSPQRSCANLPTQRPPRPPYRLPRILLLLFHSENT